MIRFEVPVIPPIVDDKIVAKRYLKSEIQKFKDCIKYAWAKKGVILRPPEGSLFKLRIQIMTPLWIGNDGKNKDSNICSRIACAQSAFCEAVDLEESRIWDCQVCKIYSREKSTLFMLDIIMNNDIYRDHAYGRLSDNSVGKLK